MENNKPMEERENNVAQQQVVTKKPFYKRWGFWVAAAIGIALTGGGVYAMKHAKAAPANKGGDVPPVKNEAEQPRVGYDNRVGKSGGDVRQHRYENNNRNNSN